MLVSYCLLAGHGFYYINYDPKAPKKRDICHTRRFLPVPCLESVDILASKQGTPGFKGHFNSAAGMTLATRWQYEYLMAKSKSYQRRTAFYGFKSVMKSNGIEEVVNAVAGISLTDSCFLADPPEGQAEDSTTLLHSSYNETGVSGREGTRDSWFSANAYFKH